MRRYIIPVVNNTMHTKPPGVCTTTLNKNSPANGDSRGYKIVAGKLKDPIPKIQPSTQSDEPQIVQCDVSNKHKVVCVSVCKEEYQCHNLQCDNVHKDICPHKTNNNLPSEVAGALTHNAPKDKASTVLSEEDAVGNTTAGSQKIVTEPTAVPVDIQKVKPNEVHTEYVQQPHISKKIVDNMASNSIYNLKKTSKCDTPLDEDPKDYD